MALTRRSVQRMSGSIWPGFVDAMTALLLVLMFVLTIFMIVQGILRETITRRQWAAAFIALCGVLIAVQPGEVAGRAAPV